ncbi:hypothetical protein D5086_001150 [Populus alba]|uniref:Uncharacterized protein n=1 Tax=Populus alba TaxID=43335 RepID=A0ACC4CY44_POPAL
MAPSSSPVSFTVRHRDPELVVPAKPVPYEQKQLSDVDDQEALRYQIPFIMFYDSNSNPCMEGEDQVKIIRAALAEALVYYYPLAGRLKEGPDGKLLVDCSGEGVLFLEADADTTLELLGDTIQPPCPYLDQLLYNVPGSTGIVGCPLLLIQNGSWLSAFQVGFELILVGPQSCGGGNCGKKMKKSPQSVQ